MNFDLDDDLTTYILSLDWKVTYIPWYTQTVAAAEYMSRFDYDDIYMKLGVM